MLQERILLGGAPGSGKTYAYLTIARALPEHKFYIIDPDDGVRRVWYPEFPEVENIEYYFTPRWFSTDYDTFDKKGPQVKKLVDGSGRKNIFQTGVADAWAVIKPKLKPDDWIDIEHLHLLWNSVQGSFADEVFDKKIGQYFLERRKAMKEGTKRLEALKGWTDWCVDKETEILTASGWKKYTSLIPGELVLTLTESLWGSQWEPLLDIYVGAHRHRKVISMEGASHSSLTTPAHRWLIQNQHKANGTYLYRPMWRTTGTLGILDRIPMSAPRLDLPLNSPIPDLLVEIIAWYITEGWVHKRNRPSLRGGISQSIKEHPEYVSRIRELLIRQFGDTGWSEYCKDDGVVLFNLGARVMEVIDEIAPNKCPTYDFLLKLTKNQLDIFIETCLAGDGASRQTGQRTFTQANKERAEVFEFACAIRGTATRTHYRDRENRQRLYTIELLRSNGVWPINSAHQLQYLEAKGKTGRSMIEEGVDENIVWCPQTPSQTWLAKRNGTVYFTGNSVINKLHNDDFIVEVCYENPGHVFMTTSISLAQSDDREDADIKAFYGDSSIRFEGQKHNPYRAQTKLIAKQIGRGQDRHYLINTFQKDRGREHMEDYEWSDFYWEYLVAMAGWS